jgi:hypothetical protein
MGPYAGVDYNLTTLQRRLQHIYHCLPYARVDIYPMPESTVFYSLVSDFDLTSGSILGLVVRGAEWGGGMSFVICNDNML